MGKQHLAIGVGMDERVLVTSSGVQMDGPLYSGGKRAHIARRQYRWDELRDVRLDLTGSSLGDKLAGTMDLIESSPTKATKSFFGYVDVTLFRRDPLSEPLSLRVPLKLRWRPDRAWVEQTQAALRAAITDPSLRERFA